MILLTPELLAAAPTKPQWTNFRGQLEQNLQLVIGPGAYQGSALLYIPDYALGYQVLKNSDPAAAANYADKALAVMESARVDIQKAGSMAIQYLARGDGHTTAFTLPNADLIPTSLQMFLCVVRTVPVTRSTASTDQVWAYAQFLKVSKTSDGSADYVQGVDWIQDSGNVPNLITWLPGRGPAAGATYYVSFLWKDNDAFWPGLNTYTLAGNVVTFATAPGAGYAVLCQYLYGTHSADGSTLAFQQTHDGTGGFCSIFIDTGYTSRYLGQCLALGLSWLQGYVGLTPARQAAYLNLLVQWSDFWRDHGYYGTSPGSNYGAGGYISRIHTALVAKDLDPVNGPRLVAEMLAYRQQYVVPLITGPQPSYVGGFWAEGWNYGPASVEHICVAGMALEHAGLIPSADAERAWAGQVIQHFATASTGPPPGQTVNWGDSYGTLITPQGELPIILAKMTTDPTLASYWNYYLQHGGGSNTGYVGHIDVLYHDLSAPAAWWDALPLQQFSAGTGCLVARSDWTENAVWMSCLMGNLANADHQDNMPGEIQIRRGLDDLILNAQAVTLAHIRQTANCLTIDDLGEGAQVYRSAPGYWYGTPGIVTSYEAGSNYSYFSGDLACAYSRNDQPGAGGSAAQLTRQVLYVRPDVVIIHDRAATKDRAGLPRADYPKIPQWYLGKAPTLTGTAFAGTAGSSVIFGQTFAPAPITTTVTSPVVAGYVLGLVQTVYTTPAVSNRFVTAFQVAAAGATAYPMQSVFGTDGRMEGAACGPVLALFGRDGLQDLTIPVTYSCPATALTHYIVDLEPGKAYTVTAGGSSKPAVASPQGTLSFIFAGVAPASVTISKGGSSPVSSTITVTFIISPPNVPPAFPQATDTVRAPAGVPLTYKMSAGGTPVPKITAAGSLPAGLSFADNLDGSFTVSGTPTTPTPAGGMPVSFTAQ